MAKESITKQGQTDSSGAVSSEASTGTDELLSLGDYFQEAKAEWRPSDALFAKLVDSGVEAMTPAEPQRRIVAEAPRASGWLAWSSWFPGLATAAAACVFAILWFPSPQGQHAPGLSPSLSQPPGAEPRATPRRAVAKPPAPRRTGLVAKGAHTLTLLHARRDAQGFAHKQTTHHGAKLWGGDLVQLQYNTEHPIYVMMLSLNRKGEVALFIPYGRSHSVRVAKGKGHLPKTGSLELDDYVGTELFFVLSSSKPFAARAAKAAIKQAYGAAKQSGSWAQIRQLPGPWEAQVIAVDKRASRR